VKKLKKRPTVISEENLQGSTQRPISSVSRARCKTTTNEVITTFHPEKCGSEVDGGVNRKSFASSGRRKFDHSVMESELMLDDMFKFRAKYPRCC